MKQFKILLVEDDNNLGTVLKEYLEIKEYDVTLCTDGKEGFDAYQTRLFDLCLLDVMLPKIDGFTIAERIRAKDADTPIVFLTAKAMKEDTLKGFHVGGDDYITKPFSMEELLLRMEAVLRRSLKNQEPENQIYNVGKFTFEYDTKKLSLDDEIQKLTSKEAELLRLLCMYKGKILDRTLALKKIWLDDSYFNARSMDVYIAKLRKYLKADEDIEIINIHGQGFKLLVK